MRAAVEEPIREKMATRFCGAQQCAGVTGSMLTGAGAGITPEATQTDGQSLWAARSVTERLAVMRAARHRMAAQSEGFAAAISPALARSKSDTVMSEVLPLLDACRYLERQAERLLKPRKLGLAGRPLWLDGVRAEIHREPVGRVLIIGPANYPLFVPGSQCLQALAAGNSVTWKPGAGGGAVAELVARALRESGLPAGVLTVTEETVEAAQRELERGADKVIFTGSFESGRAVLAELAGTATPAVMELSGADAIVVLPGADLRRVAKAVAFGLRLNGAAVCMSPRRLFANAATLKALRPLLDAELAQVPPVALPAKTAATLRSLVEDAVRSGAIVQGEVKEAAQRPLLVELASPSMAIARSDIFAPVISLLEADSMMHLTEMYAQCPYGLTATIFCGPREMKRARALAQVLRAGTVLINDLIAPTVDPRVCFGGRGASGYGVTRGAEGLLEMTAVKTLLIRRSRNTLHMDPTTDADAPMFSGYVAAMHGKGWMQRWQGWGRLITGLKARM